MGEKRAKKTLSLITFNTLGTPFFAPDITKRYRKIAQLINNKEYDIICLQEVFTYYHLALLQKIITVFPYICYEKTLVGPKGGLVIFSKFPLSNRKYTTYSFPKTVQAPFYWKLAKQGILSVIIADYAIRLCNTHLSSDIEHNLSPKNKLYNLIRNQTHEAANVVSRYTEQNESVILAGDFNITKASHIYQEFTKKTKLNDIFATNEKPSYDPTRLKYIYTAKKDRCDYIFTKSLTPSLKVLSTEYLFSEQEVLFNGKKSYLSDHIALHCILGVNE